MKTYRQETLNAFQDGNGNLIPLPESVCYKKILYTQYDLEIMNGLKYAVGWNPILLTNANPTPMKDGRETYTFRDAQHHIICHNGDLLFSLLRLSDLNLNDDKIITWSKNYGLPFEDKSLWTEHKKIGFSITKFQSRVNELRYYFERWESNHYDEALSVALELNAEIKLELSHDKNNIQYYITAVSAFSAAYVQLIMLISNQNREAIRKCRCCDGWFSPERRNKYYCPECTPQKKYSRKKRKEENNNA